MEKYTVIKYKDKYGYVEIPSNLNKIIMEDNSILMLGEDEVEVIEDDRSRKFIKEVNELYSE